MPTFKATSPEGVITEYDATLPDPEHLQPGWRLEQIIIAEASPDAPEPVPTGKVMTKREFIKRFTVEEYAGIKAASTVNATLDYYWQMFMLAEEINTDDADTVSGVQMLEAAGLIAAGRGVEILYA